MVEVPVEAARGGCDGGDCDGGDDDGVCAAGFNMPGDKETGCAGASGWAVAGVCAALNTGARSSPAKSMAKANCFISCL